VPTDFDKQARAWDRTVKLQYLQTYVHAYLYLYINSKSVPAIRIEWNGIAVSRGEGQKQVFTRKPCKRCFYPKIPPHLTRMNLRIFM
jgi:hypothetical protein